MSVGGGTSRAEALLEERRRVLRTALKGEYIRCVIIETFLSDPGIPGVRSMGPSL